MISDDKLLKVWSDAWDAGTELPLQRRRLNTMRAVAAYAAEKQRESDRDYMRTAYRTDVLRVPLVTDAVPSQD